MKILRLLPWIVVLSGLTRIRSLSRLIAHNCKRCLIRITRVGHSDQCFGLREL